MKTEVTTSLPLQPKQVAQVLRLINFLGLSKVGQSVIKAECLSEAELEANYREYLWWRNHLDGEEEEFFESSFIPLGYKDWQFFLEAQGPYFKLFQTRFNYTLGGEPIWSKEDVCSLYRNIPSWEAAEQQVQRALGEKEISYRSIASNLGARLERGLHAAEHRFKVSQLKRRSKLETLAVERLSAHSVLIKGVEPDFLYFLTLEYDRLELFTLFSQVYEGSYEPYYSEERLQKTVRSSLKLLSLYQVMGEYNIAGYHLQVYDQKLNHFDLKYLARRLTVEGNGLDPMPFIEAGLQRMRQASAGLSLEPSYSER